MSESTLIVEEVTDPAHAARLRLQDERHRRNTEEWLQAHWPDLLPQARGNFLAVAEQETFIADTPEEAWAWIEKAHPGDNGAIVRYVRQEKGPRMYVGQG
jgi:hypothetical protein